MNPPFLVLKLWFLSLPPLIQPQKRCQTPFLAPGKGLAPFCRLCDREPSPVAPLSHPCHTPVAGAEVEGRGFTFAGLGKVIT